MRPLMPLRLAVVGLLVLAACSSAPKTRRVHSAPQHSEGWQPDWGEVGAYGFTPANPIHVGGGPGGQRAFLEALTGPHGEPLAWRRLDSCCVFETPNGMMGLGLLDLYEVMYEGLERPVILYLDMYDSAPVTAPASCSRRAMRRSRPSPTLQHLRASPTSSSSEPPLPARAAMRPILLMPMLLWLSACASFRSTALGPNEYGTRHPFLLQGASPDGRWLIACQAREDTNGDGQISIFSGMHGDTYGDNQAPYLFLEPGAGERIDAAIAADRSGRFLVVVRDASLRLIDTRTRNESELTPLRPLEREEDDATTPPPVADFSEDGRRLLFLRRESGKVVAVVRELDSGREQRVEAGPGELRRASFDPSGTWALFQVLNEDTDQDGTLRWPTEITNLGPPPCRGKALSFTTGGWKGDQPVFRMRRVEGGPLYEGGDLLQPVGPFMLRRGAQGELLAEDASGQRTEWVPASCQGRLLHADSERQLVVVACTAGRGHWDPVELHGASVHQPLGLKVAAPYNDRNFQEPTRLVTLYGAPLDAVPTPSERSSVPELKGQDFLVDLEQRTARAVPGIVESTHGPTALISEFVRSEASARNRWEGNVRLSLLNVATGEQTVLTESKRSSELKAGPLLLYGEMLVDLESGRMLGEASGRTDSLLAIDTQGRGLHIEVKEGQSLVMGHVPSGPVRWEPLLPP